MSQIGGNTVFNSLNIPGSARISALGGNLISVKDSDHDLGVYNPSLLDSNMHQSISLSYVNYFSDVNFGYASYAHHIDSLATFAATVQYMGYGDFKETDIIGQEIGSFSAGDFAFTLGAGIPVDTSFTVGANLKFLYSAIAGYTSSGIALDLGATYFNPKRRFTAALVIKNMGYQLKSYTADNKEKMPTEIQIGISKTLKHAPFRFSVIAENLQQWDLTYANPNEVQSIDPVTGEVISESKFEFGDKLMRHMVIGAELMLSENIHIRLGYNYRRRQELKLSEKAGIAGLSFGFGVKVKRFRISYGRATYHLAGSSNHFSVSTSLANLF